MAKSSNEKSTTPKAAGNTQAAKKGVVKPKKQLNEDDDLDLEGDDTPKAGRKGGLKSKSANEDDVEVEDEWEKPTAEADDWDPDFDEFDLPKSSAKKAAVGKKAPKDDDDDFKMDDEFKDMFGGGGPRSKYSGDDDDDF